jgi:Diadenosine tetraphosphate (Ap4A) hydrolase and other HIT family hydrolases
MASIFSKIISREIPGYIVAEDEQFCAFLDIMPLVPGHTLVVPKSEVDYIFDIDDKMLSDMMVFAKKVSKAVRKAVPCKRIGVP